MKKYVRGFQVATHNPATFTVAKSLSMTKYGRLLGFTLLLLIATLATHGQKIDDTDTRALVHANYIYQFATNCNWPTEVKKGKFYIGVIGNTPVAESLKEKYGSKPAGNQIIEIIALTDIPTTQFFHILFIDKSRKADLAKANRELKSKNTLIVTNWEGALLSGAQINFINVSGAIRYEMNESSINERRIQPGIKIIQWKID